MTDHQDRGTIWPSSYEAKVLDALPTTGPEPIQFLAVPQGRGREGLVVEVTQGLQSWIGNFQKGDGKFTGVFATPSRDHLCIVAGGRPYRVCVNDPLSYDVVEAYPVQDVRPIPDLDLLVLADHTDLIALGAEGTRWRSSRVSWDGIRIVRAAADGIVGSAWDAAEEREVGFFVDARTGRLEGGAAPPLGG